MSAPDPDKARGLYGKYEVHKLRREVKQAPGGSTLTVTERVDPGPVFVLAYATDPIARHALSVYAREAHKAGYVALAADLLDELERTAP